MSLTAQCLSLCPGGELHEVLYFVPCRLTDHPRQRLVWFASLAGHMSRHRVASRRSKLDILYYEAYKRQAWAQ